MSAIIRGTPAFMAGGIVLVEHEVALADDGFVEAQMNFACLASSLATNLPRFAQDRPPPLAASTGGVRLPSDTGLPQDLANLRLERNNVFLTKLVTSVEKGIAYLTGVFVGVSAYQQRRITETEQIRGFGGRRRFNLFRLDNGQSAGFTFSRISFEYTAVVRSVSYAAIGQVSEPQISGSIKDIRNRNGFSLPTLPGVRSTPVGAGWRVEQYASLTKTPVGIVTRFVKSAEAVVVTTET